MTPAPARPPTDQRAWHADIMGMPISVRMRGTGLHRKPIQSAVDRVFDWLRRVDAVFSPYRRDSEFLRHRRGELAPSACDPLLPEVFQLCAEASARTDGWFDPQIDVHPGRALDPTGVVKGWAVQRAGDLLAELDQYDHYVNAAGDITMVVHDDASPAWRLGIADPSRDGGLIDVVHGRNGGIATSGTAARGGHVYNPFTGRPATELASVTVLGPELVWADVYATAALARGISAAGWLDTLVDHEYFLLAADGRRRHSRGWPGLRVATGPSGRCGRAQPPG